MHPTIFPMSKNDMNENSSAAVEFNDKVILITGGTGSFGQKFAETVLQRYKPRKLIIFSRDEAKQFDMNNKTVFKDQPSMRYFIGDVRDFDRLEMAFRDVDYVIHTAAIKHITAAEYNPFECIKTNVHGAENVVRAAIRTGVQKVVALSTDKAANPINLYGASKLASDKIFVAAKVLAGGDQPQFCAVRYGNVIGSRGSVVPFFQQQINQGVTSLPITDIRMTRFWITLQKGVEFVLSCFSMSQGGEIFVPKIPSMKTTELARIMAPDLDTHVIGIRAGEKLHEVMITEDEARTVLELPDRYIIRPMLYGEQNDYHADERPVAEDFRYTSDTNTDWITDDKMRQLLADLDLPTRASSVI